jgi:hypothetical protein
LSAAFDVALSKLGLVDRTDPATLAIAKRASATPSGYAPSR